MTLVIMTIAGKAISMWTKRDTVLVIATLEAGEREVVSICVTNTNRA